MNDVVMVFKDKIKSNQDILKLLKYTDSEIDIYAQSDLSGSEARSIAKSFIKETPMNFDDNNAACFIILMYGNKQYHANRNIYFNGNTFDIYIACANSIKFNDIVGDRCLEIEAIIRDMFDDVVVDGIMMKTYAGNSSSILPTKGYSGRYLTLQFADFNG